jgi:hypothetical protein
MTQSYLDDRLNKPLVKLIKSIQEKDLNLKECFWEVVHLSSSTRSVESYEPSQICNVVQRVWPHRKKIESIEDLSVKVDLKIARETKTRYRYAIKKLVMETRATPRTLYGDDIPLLMWSLLG